MLFRSEQGLSALIIKPVTGQIPRNHRAEGYLESRSVPKDPWGNEFIYLSPGEQGDYSLCSLGAEGVKGGEGKSADICNWNIQ